MQLQYSQPSRNQPTGMSTAGFFTSSARVETQSKPINAKKTYDAPLKMPETLLNKSGKFKDEQQRNSGVRDAGLASKTR